MIRLRLQHTVELPDPVRLARYRKAPELGPRVLFFSGGTALRSLSRELVNYTHHSIHLITPFDSGGSSAKLREAFHMLAVGDVRNRLMALADRSVQGNPEIFRLFAHRLPEEGDLGALLAGFAGGKDPLIACVPDPMRKIIRSHLGFFLERMPADFDLRGASIGNLILAGGFFNYQRRIDPVIFLFSKLVEARGVVRPVVNKDLDLAVELQDGRVIVGQHLITGKQASPLDSPIQRIFLARSRDRREAAARGQADVPPTPAQPAIRKKIESLILGAELICYPMGSFYSSLIANLLPKGVCRAVSRADCPKIYIPNTGHDPEQVGMSVHRATTVLLDTLRSNCERQAKVGNLLNFVLVDTKNGRYPEPLELSRIRRLGVEVLDTELVTEESRPYLDPNKVLEILFSLV